MRVNTPILSAAARLALEDGHRTGLRHCYRTRCFSILLKAEGRESEEVGAILNMHRNTVNSWVKRYNESGIEGLVNKPGQGRKPLISVEEDGQAIKELVKDHRQRVSVAQAEWEANKETTVSSATFRRFLKELADGTSASKSVVKAEKA
jgi:transposase